MPKPVSVINKNIKNIPKNIIDDSSSESDDDTLVEPKYEEDKDEEDKDEEDKDEEDKDEEDTNESEDEDNDEEENEDCLYKKILKKDDDDDDGDDFEIVYDDDDISETGVVKPEERMTKPFITLFEKVRILGDRAKQLSLGAKPMIKGLEINYSPKEIAKIELENGVIPLIIERELPNGKKEHWIPSKNDTLI